VLTWLNAEEARFLHERVREGFDLGPLLYRVEVFKKEDVGGDLVKVDTGGYSSSSRHIPQTTMTPRTRHVTTLWRATRHDAQKPGTPAELPRPTPGGA
jgi:hypothetical protein